MFKRKNSKGVTLIELVIILALLGILAGITVPSMDWSNYYLRTQARQLCAEIRNVRVLRMTEGVDYKVSLNRDFYQINNGIKQVKKVNMLSNYKIYYNNQEITFNYNSGAPDKGDTITIKNVKNGRSMEITIVPASGRVLLKDEIFLP